MNLFSLDPFNSLCPVQKSQEIITDFPQEDVILVTDLSVRTLSGVERWEREKKQNIIINLWIFCDTQSSAQQDSLACSFNYGIIAKTVTNYCEESSFKTLEALAFSIAKLCILENQVPKITVRVSKPCGRFFFCFRISVMITYRLYQLVTCASHSFDTSKVRKCGNYANKSRFCHFFHLSN
eukprot:Sdes_comp20850_c0_seq2m17586